MDLKVKEILEEAQKKLRPEDQKALQELRTLFVMMAQCGNPVIGATALALAALDMMEVIKEVKTELDQNRKN